VPAQVRAYLNLPATDQGIDLIAQTVEGEYWAIQCKYRDDDAASLTWEEISTFVGLSSGICKNISYSLIAFSGERYAKLLHKGERIGFLTGEEWHRLGEQFFADLRALEHREPITRATRRPRPHQARAIEKAVTYFTDPTHTRGKLIMPCGTGKSLTAFWIAEKLEAETIVVAVPSLALMRQTLHVWLEELAARGREVRWLCVCSDETVGQSERDDVAVYAQDLGVPCATDEPTITSWLSDAPASSLRIVITTYQSGKVLAAASRAAKATFDLGLFDEAHKTVGQKGKVFGHLLFDEHLSITRRVFMTATERRYAGESDEILSMDNPSVYGETFELLSFKEALEQEPPILADYKVITMLVGEGEIAELIEHNAYLRPEGEHWREEIEAQSLAALIALRKAVERYPIRHAVSFHLSIQRARRFRETNDRYSEAMPETLPLATFHVTGAMPTSVREREVREFAKASHALITNAAA
jgi:predicted helicase